MSKSLPLVAGLLAALLLTPGCGRVSATQASLTASPSTKTSGVAGSVSVRPADLKSGSLTVSGNGSLSGRVVALGENNAQRPVAGASVLIQETGQKLVTDATGTFRAASVPAGNYTFTAMTTGLTQVSPAGVLVEANQAATVPDITMAPGAGPSGITSITYVQAGAFGQEAEAPAALVAPLGVAVRAGDVLVLDVNNMPGVKTGIVRQYAADGGKFAGKFGDYTKWLGLNQMRNTVKAICLDAQGRALVLDGARQVWRFKPDGSKDKVFSVDVDNGTDIAVDATGNILIAHAGGLTKLNPEGDSPAPLGNSGQCAAIAGAKDGLWAVVGNKVQKLNSDGTMVMEFGPSGAGAKADESFSGATDVAVDARNGNLVVVDKGAKNVYVYDAAGTLIGKIGQGVFDTPVAATVNTDGTVFVLDAAKKKVYKFSPAAIH